MSCASDRSLPTPALSLHLAPSRFHLPPSPSISPISLSSRSLLPPSRFHPAPVSLHLAPPRSVSQQPRRRAACGHLGQLDGLRHRARRQPVRQREPADLLRTVLKSSHAGAFIALSEGGRRPRRMVWTSSADPLSAVCCTFVWSCGSKTGARGGDGVSSVKRTM